MKLSTRSRYGTRLILDMAQQNGKVPIQLGEIARRQNISLKYLEQIIRPLKRANYIKSFRGSKGGHLLNKDPGDITVGEVVALLEGSSYLTTCLQKPQELQPIGYLPHPVPLERSLAGVLREPQPDHLCRPARHGEGSGRGDLRYQVIAWPPEGTSNRTFH